MADDKDIADGDDAPKGKKKLILIIVIALVLLLGGGAAAFFLLGGDDENADAAADAEAEPEVVVEEGDPVYHKFDPPFVVNLPEGKSAGMLQVAIEVMTRNPTVVATLTTNGPMIRHHLLNLLEDQDADALMTPEGREALQTAIGDVLATQLEALDEHGTIKGVFFTQFVLQ